MREFPKRSEYQREIDKANEHPLNKAAAMALDKTTWTGKSSELEALTLAMWAIEEDLFKIPDQVWQTVCLLSGPRYKAAMHVLTHNTDGGEVDLMEDAADPSDPESLAWAILNHLMSYYLAANPPISNK